MSYAHPDLQASCHVRDQIYATEVISITCGPADLPFDYSLFASVGDLRAAYFYDVAGAETPPQPDGTCPEGNFEAIYERDGGPVGRINCREHTSSTGSHYHVLEWTHEPLLVIGYISNKVDTHTWDDLIAFWNGKAGPFPAG